MEKILCMNVAATLASGVLANRPDNLALDPDIKDPNLRLENLMQWELFRIFYVGVVTALSDDKSWPPPPAGKVSLGGLLPPGLADSALKFAEPLIKELFAKFLPAPSQPQLTANVPNPGQPG